MFDINFTILSKMELFAVHCSSLMFIDVYWDVFFLLHLNHMIVYEFVWFILNSFDRHYTLVNALCHKSSVVTKIRILHCSWLENSKLVSSWLFIRYIVSALPDNSPTNIFMLRRLDCGLIVCIYHLLLDIGVIFTYFQ